MSHSAASRDAGRLTRSSSRAAAQPKARVALVLVADHAVGGVDRLVERAADEAAERGPQDRRDDAVGEILRQALDRRARDARLVQRLRIAADDLRRPRGAPRRDPRRARRRPRSHERRGCAAPAGSRREARARRSRARRHGRSARVASHATSATGREIEAERDDAHRPAGGEARVGAIERAPPARRASGPSK